MIDSDTDYDKCFDNISHLERYPWVGHKYTISLNKILVIGESHYLQRGNDNEEQYLASVEKHNRKTFTRDVIKDVANKCFTNKTYVNLNKILKLDTRENLAEFYSRIAFYNFVQKPVNHIKDRPNDFKKDLDVFHNLIRLLEPDFCLFIGTTVCKQFRTAAELPGIVVENFKFHQKTGRCYPCSFSIQLEQKNLKCIGIRHTSRLFAGNEIWSSFLKDNGFDCLFKTI